MFLMVGRAGPTVRMTRPTRWGLRQHQARWGACGGRGASGAIVLRTALVFSEYGNNFVKPCCVLRKSVTYWALSGIMGCPTYAGDSVQAIIELLKREAAGVYHFCGNKEVSWSESPGRFCGGARAGYVDEVAAGERYHNRSVPYAG